MSNPMPPAPITATLLPGTGAPPRTSEYSMTLRWMKGGSEEVVRVLERRVWENADILCKILPNVGKIFKLTKFYKIDQRWYHSTAPPHPTFEWSIPGMLGTRGTTPVATTTRS